jgi:hypothetical protein
MMFTVYLKKEMDWLISHFGYRKQLGCFLTWKVDLLSNSAGLVSWIDFQIHLGKMPLLL